MLVWLSQLTLSISILLLVMFGLQRVIRHQTAWMRYQLWNWTMMAVIALAIISILPAITITLPGNSNRYDIDRRYYPTGSVYFDATSQTNEQITTVPSSNGDTTTDIATNASPVDTSTSIMPSSTTVNPREIIEVSGFILWLIGVTLIIGRYLLATWQIHNIKNNSQPVSDDWHYTLKAICSEHRLNIPEPVLCQSQQVSVPMVIGFRSPTILLPDHTATALPAEKRLILLHECVHIKRRDILMQSLTLLAYALQWFNPLIWLARRNSTVLCEQACDEVVLDNGIDRQIYARYLVDMARTAIRNRTLAAITMPLTSRSQLTERIESILGYTTRPVNYTSRLSLRLLIVFVLSLLLSTQLPVNIRAQSTQVLTLTVPDYMESNRSSLNAAIADFEAQNPQLQVQVVTAPVLFGSLQNPDNIDNYLEQMRNRAESGDVLLLESAALNPAATRAGYLLDAGLLANGDNTFSPGSYRPAAWEAFQWDGGVWAMPALVSPVGMLYDRQIFDTAGLPYPDASWTVDDLERAAQILTGDSAGLQVNNSTGILVHALSDIRYVDDAFPAQPDLSHPALPELAQRFGTLLNNGALSQFTPADDTALLMASWSFRSASGNGTPLTMASLPGGQVAVEAWGYAVSAGTPAPQAAYELAKFLSMRPEILANFAAAPALQSAGIDVMPRLTRDDLTQIDRLLEATIPAQDIIFSESFDAAVLAINTGTSPEIALETVALDLTAALPASPTAEPIILQTPVPQPQTGSETAGETLTFAIDSSFAGGDPTPWEEQFEQFALDEPLIDAVEIVFPPDQPVDLSDRIDAVLAADCGYIRYLLDYQYYTDRFLDLSPLLAADFSFNPDDLIGDGLAATTADGRVYMLPASIEPFVIGYAPTLFDANGIPQPASDWTLSDWTNTLQEFASVPAYNEVVLSPQAFATDLTMIEILIALYGGQLFTDDRRSLNLDDPQTAVAVREIINQAKSGVLEYIPLASFQQGFDIVRNTPLIISTLSDQTIGEGGATINSGILGSNASGRQPYNIVPLPDNRTLTPYGYDVTGLFISADTAFVDACFNLIRRLQEQPVLFGGLPPFTSLADDAAVTATVSPEILDFYNRWIERVASPDTIRIPTLAQRSFTDYAMGRIFARAMDRIVLENQPVDAELGLAQEIADDVTACAGDDFDPADEEAAFDALRECMDAVDPTLFSN